MRLEKYISDLLYRYQCVTVPGFGSFLTQNQSATVDTNTNTFYPPTKLLSFNAQLKSNDGLLTKYVSEAEDISYEIAAHQIEEVVLRWKKSLNNKEKINLKNIGDLTLSEDSKFIFDPVDNINYLTSSFGLSSMVTPTITREVLKKEVEALEENTPILFTPEKRARRSYLKYAAIFLLAISSGAFGYQMLNKQQVKNYQVVEQEAQEEVQKNIQEATFFDTTPIEMPSITLDLAKEPLKYHIVAGAFRVETNADKRIKQLQAKGYKSADKIGVNKYGLHQVSYASFAEVNEALQFLSEIKTKESSEAWLLVSE
ncbi:SPOR domain-containing protein [Zhouia amylolytica]|uniref:HU domain-containing protein n=1 Tax=Zhouia amylolytica TaxID=376730 RepID=UPI0020CE4DF0|nr:SPOR domain-containing protein [Zhouia amylolytica]MCQ0112373.1 SPOR domain-containing protein [Zhouia amylolytica]